MSAGGIVAQHFAEVSKCQMRFQAFRSSTPIFFYYFESAAVAVDSTLLPLSGVESVHLQILLISTCEQCGSWSVAGHNHRKVIE